MPSFDSEGVSIAYEERGAGAPVVLVHGFASNRRDNSEATRWYETLVAAGRKVVALDCRGHGESDKPHAPEAYAAPHMTGDVLRMMDRLGIERADLMGYSMGGRLSAALIVAAPHRFRSAVLAGIGAAIVGAKSFGEPIARALEAPDSSSIRDPAAKAFRVFAKQRNNDLLALAACMRGLQPEIGAADLGAVRMPVLIVAGDKDTLIGNPQRLADLIPGARVVPVPGKDHIGAVADRVYKDAVVRFLADNGLEGAAAG